MTNSRTINLSEKDMAALARRNITDLPISVSLRISGICRGMVMETAKKFGIVPTLRFRSMLYPSFGVIATLDMNPSWLIKQAATRAVREYFNGTR